MKSSFVQAVRTPNTAMHKNCEKGFEEVFDSDSVECVELEFRKYFDRVHEFNNVLQNCEAIVSGSTILACLLHAKSYGTDLDIVIKSENLYLMREYLEREGYQISKYQGGNNRITGPWFYVGMFCPRKNKKIDLCVLFQGKPADYVAAYDLTCVMNYWDGFHLYSAFFTLTREKKVSYFRFTKDHAYSDEVVVQDSGKRNYHRYQKYIDRGFALTEVNNDLPFCGMKPMHLNTKSYEEFRKDVQAVVETTLEHLVEEFHKMTTDCEIERRISAKIPYGRTDLLEKKLTEIVDWPKDSIALRVTEDGSGVVIDVSKVLLD